MLTLILVVILIYVAVIILALLLAITGSIPIVATLNVIVVLLF